MNTDAAGSTEVDDILVEGGKSHPQPSNVVGTSSSTTPPQATIICPPSSNLSLIGFVVIS